MSLACYKNEDTSSKAKVDELDYINRTCTIEVKYCIELN